MRDRPIKIANGFRLQWEQAQASFVLLYPEGMIKLNTTAGEILSHIDGKRNAHDIVEALQQKFPDADLKADVEELLATACDNGWIE